MTNAWTTEIERLRSENAILRQSNTKLMRSLMLELRKQPPGPIERGDMEAMERMMDVGRVNGGQPE